MDGALIRPVRGESSPGAATSSHVGKTSRADSEDLFENLL